MATWETLPLHLQDEIQNEAFFLHVKENPLPFLSELETYVSRDILNIRNLILEYIEMYECEDDFEGFHGPKFEAWCYLGAGDPQYEWESIHTDMEPIEDIKTMVRFLMESKEGWEKVSEKLYDFGYR